VNISHRFFLFFGIILAVLIGVFILVMSSNTLLRNETGKMSQTLDLSVEQIVFNNSLNTLARKTSTTLRQISLLGYADRLENVQRVKGNFVDQLKDIRNQVSALSQNAVLSKDRGLFFCSGGHPSPFGPRTRVFVAHCFKRTGDQGGRTASSVQSSNCGSGSRALGGIATNFRSGKKPGRRFGKIPCRIRFDDGRVW